MALPLWTCPDCGGTLTNPKRVRCEACIEADLRQAPEVRGGRGAAIAARKRALVEWDRSHPEVAYDPDLFRREILPRLATVKLTEIMAATGMSKGSASDVRRGKWTPHVSTWAALAMLVDLGGKDTRFILATSSFQWLLPFRASCRILPARRK